MMDSTLRVAGLMIRVAKTEHQEEVARILVLENKTTEERPAAIGYFVLNFIKELSSSDCLSSGGQSGQYPTVEITLADIPVGLLQMVDSRADSLMADDYGVLYDLVSRVEYNKPEGPH